MVWYVVFCLELIIKIATVQLLDGGYISKMCFNQAETTSSTEWHHKWLPDLQGELY